MNRGRLICQWSLFACMMTACQSSRQNLDEVVCETVHRYGVSVPTEEWSERGADGQVISMRKDGVIINRSYEGGVLQGPTTYTFPHRDVIQRKEQYDKGVLQEEWVYEIGGLPQQHILYDTPLSSQCTVWYETGAPQCQEYIVEGKLLKGIYYDGEQQVESRVEEGEGWRTRRDGVGQLQSKDAIQNGHMVSRTTYHPFGTPATLSPYCDGVIEGMRRTFSPSGTPITLETWKGGLQHGLTILFEQGEKYAEIPYVHGQKHGIERRYRNGTLLIQEVTWVKGMQHGPLHSYLAGTKRTDWYFRGQRVANKATFDMLSEQ